MSSQENCPTGILVDLSSPTEKIQANMHNCLKLSDFAGDAEPFNAADNKNLLTPTVDIINLSPSTMSTISREASKLVSRLKICMEDQQHSLLADEVFPLALSFDDCSLELSLEASPTVDEINYRNVEFKKSPVGMNTSHSMQLLVDKMQDKSSLLEVPSKPDINMSDIANRDMKEISPTVNKKESSAKTVGSNLREIKKHSFLKKGALTKNKIGLTEPLIKKQFKSPNCKLDEHVSKYTADVTISNLNKSLTSKSDSPILSSYLEKDQLSIRKSHSKITSIKQICTPRSSKSTKPNNSDKENKMHEMEDVYGQRFLQTPKSLAAIFCPETNRQALSPLKNIPTPKSIKSGMRQKLFLEKSPIIRRQSFVQEQKGSHGGITTKLLQPTDMGVKKAISKSSLKVPTSFYTPRQSISAEVKLKGMNPPKSVQQINTTACTPISYRTIKASTSHNIPEYVKKPVSGKKISMSKSGQVNSVKSPSFTTPLQTPQSSRKSSAARSQRIQPPFTPLSSNEASRRLSYLPLSSEQKLSRRLSFIPSRAFSAKK